ncbi:hypothetical protein AB0K71_05850 [Streptomyces syringium]|uniref:hypothetical protein n=1 Tax=Streptomyces syringium TaxID=76729 RepID=UPI00343B12CA
MPKRNHSTTSSTSPEQSSVPRRSPASEPATTDHCAGDYDAGAEARAADKKRQAIRRSKGRR